MANLKENKTKVLAYFGVSTYRELPHTFFHPRFIKRVERATQIKLVSKDLRKASFWSFMATALLYYQPYLNELPTIERAEKLNSLKSSLKNYRRNIEETESSILDLEIDLAEISASEPVYAKPFYLSILQENGGGGDNTNCCQRVTFELAPTQDETVKGHCKDFRVLVTSYMSKDSGVNFTKCSWDTMPLNHAEPVVRGLFKQSTFYRTTRWEVEHIQDHHYGIMIETEYRELIRPYHLHCKYNYFVNQYRYGQSELPQIDTGMIADPEVCYG